MGIYIQGLEMPKEGCIEILIHSDGIVQLTGKSVRIEGVDYYTPYIGEKPEMHTAVHVPPHGKLIDADEFFNDICNSLNEMTAIGVAVDGEWMWGKLNDALRNAPAVLEAEEGVA